MNRLSFSSLLLLAALLAPTVEMQAAEIYRWVDENGTVHYGERPPDGVDAEPVGVAQAAPRAPQADVAPTADTPSTDSDVVPGTAEPESKSYAQQVRDDRRARTEQRRQDQAKLDAQCEAMRQQLARLEPSPRVIINTPDGGTRRMDDEERLQAIDESRSFISANCD